MTSSLILHIATCTIGYGLFACAFLIACVYIHQDRTIKTKKVKLNGQFSWSLQELDNYLFVALILGLVFLSIGIATGTLAHKQQYGIVDYTSIRLIIPTIIWLFYLLILCFRYLTGLRGKATAYLAAYGFNCVAFSFIVEMILTKNL